MVLQRIVKEKCTLKDFETTGILKFSKNQDFLFITAKGYIIGKPYYDKDSFISSFILLSDVVHIDGNIKRVFNNMIIRLAIDQIIAFSPVDRDSFFDQMQLSEN